MSFTPGPWSYDDERAHEDRPTGYYGVCGDNDETVCRNATLDDARLIASAPLLLAVCLKLQEYFDTEGGFDLNDARDMADDAVRAALPQPEEPKRG